VSATLSDQLSCTSYLVALYLIDRAYRGSSPPLLDNYDWAGTFLGTKDCVNPEPLLLEILTTLQLYGIRFAANTVRMTVCCSVSVAMKLDTYVGQA
jgi:hypothetical protein